MVREKLELHSENPWAEKWKPRGAMSPLKPSATRWIQREPPRVRIKQKTVRRVLLNKNVMFCKYRKLSRGESMSIEGSHKKIQRESDAQEGEWQASLFLASIPVVTPWELNCPVIRSRKIPEVHYTFGCDEVGELQQAECQFRCKNGRGN